MQRIRAIVLSAGVLAASPPAVVSAQDVTVDRSQGVTVLGLGALYFNEGDNLSGFGARLTLNFGQLINSTNALLNRSEIGGYAVFTQTDGVDGLHIGSELDLRLFSQPVAEIVDPFVAFGPGLFRLSNGDSETNLTLTPAVGAYFDLIRGSVITFRADLRYVIVVGGDVLDSFFETQAGVGFRF